MNDYLPLFSSIVVLFGVGLMVWMSSHTAAGIDRWADENDYEIIRKENRTYGKNPFMFNSRAHAVYFIEVIDTDEQRRTGWLKYRIHWTDLDHPSIEVIWDEETAS